MKITVMGPVRDGYPSADCMPVRFEYACPGCRKPQDVVYDVTKAELAEVQQWGMNGKPHLWECEGCQADWDEIRFATGY